MNSSYVPKVRLAEESLEACVSGKKIALMVMLRLYITMAAF